MSRKVYVYDLETLPDLFTATFLDRDSDETVVFHSNQDDYIKNMLSFLNKSVQGLIGYNCIAFDGQMWPSRLIGFSIGAIVFSWLSWAVFSEPLTMKTFICLVLALGILLVQLFVK